MPDSTIRDEGKYPSVQTGPETTQLEEKDIDRLQLDSTCSQGKTDHGEGRPGKGEHTEGAPADENHRVCG